MPFRQLPPQPLPRNSASKADRRVRGRRARSRRDRRSAATGCWGRRRRRRIQSSRLFTGLPPAASCPPAACKFDSPVRQPSKGSVPGRRVPAYATRDLDRLPDGLRRNARSYEPFPPSHRRDCRLMWSLGFRPGTCRVDRALPATAHRRCDPLPGRRLDLRPDPGQVRRGSPRRLCRRERDLPRLCADHGGVRRPREREPASRRGRRSRLACRTSPGCRIFSSSFSSSTASTTSSRSSPFATRPTPTATASLVVSDASAGPDAGARGRDSRASAPRREAPLGRRDGDDLCRDARPSGRRRSRRFARSRRRSTRRRRASSAAPTSGRPSPASRRCGPGSSIS